MLILNIVIKFYALGTLFVRDAFRHWQNDNFIVTHCGIYAGASIRCNKVNLLFPDSARDRESYRGAKEAYRLL